MLGKANTLFNNSLMHDCQEAMQSLLHGTMAHTGATTIQTVSLPASMDPAEMWPMFTAQNGGRVFDTCSGMLSTTYKCCKPECTGESTVWETFNILPLTLPCADNSTVTLEALLTNFEQPFTMPPQNKWTCNKCNNNEAATAERKIKRWPDVLIIHLVRTAYAHASVQKISADVQYPDVLQSPNKHLMAVVTHIKSPKHFKVLAKRNEGIFEFDDSVVKPVDTLQSKDAYMLLYCHSTTTATKIFGLRNLSNTCYLAAAVQALASCVDIVPWVTRLAFRRPALLRLMLVPV